MHHILFISGYPGFLARNLVRQIIQDHGETIQHIYLLVLPQELEKAQKELKNLTKAESAENKFTLVAGDITKKELGIDEGIAEKLRNSVTHLFHLAAIYDLAVPEDIAYRVNVHGTQTVTNWARGLSRLKRYVYFSTAYVSGTREGKIFETELVMGQNFKNHYEATKFEAEVIVETAKDEMPVTIIRPGIVKGHSVTGETIKFDGMYFVLNLFDRLALSPLLPYLGDGHVEGNFVPSDYVLKATSYLAFNEDGAGKTYHLTDPNPYTMKELYQMIAEAYLGRTPKGKIPIRIASLPMKSQRIQKWLQVEQQALDYFTVDASYDTSQAMADLAGSGISCPDLKDTIGPMIAFYRKYKHDYEKHIVM